MMPRKLAVSMLLGAIALVGCGAPPPAVNPDQVGAAGGTVTSTEPSTMGTVVTVPPAAVATDVTLAFTGCSEAPTLASGWATAGPCVHIDPAAETFTAAVTIDLPLTDGTATAVYTRVGSMGDWTQVQGAHVNTATNTIEITTTTLGDFVAAHAVLACAANVPATNFCSMESCNFRPLSLPQCDTDGSTPSGSTNYDFYNTDYCSNQLTLLVVAAGWCNPCMQEAPMIESLITQAYAGRVRVVSVMFQNADYSAPTCAFAMGWRTRFGLSNHMLIDPHGDTQIYYPGMAFPANLLINSEGQIVYRAYGTSAGLSDLQQAIENNLPGS